MKLKRENETKKGKWNQGWKMELKRENGREEGKQILEEKKTYFPLI